MSSPACAFGHQKGFCSSWSLAVASSWSCGHRSVWPFTNPVAWAIASSPALLKSSILTSQPQPDHAVPEGALSSTHGASPARSLARRSAWFLAVDMNWKLLSSMPHDVVMLLTNMSKMPSWLRSPKSTPMPLKESWPIVLDLGISGVRTPSTGESLMCPGVDWL